MSFINKYYYSERGIVHSIIEDIYSGTEQEQKRKASAFLNSIEFLDKPGPFEDIEITSISFIKEPDFSQFGSPDLILVVNDDTVIFIEAKLSSYEKSAISIVYNEEDKFKNNMSKINVQLALKYRFWEALTCSGSNAYKAGIEEDTGHIAFYDADSRGRRRLLNEFVLYRYVSKLAGCNKSYFVAMTNDSTRFSEDHPMNRPGLRPPLFIETESGIHNRWLDPDVKKKFGMVRYKSLVDNSVVSKNDGSLYDFASSILREESAKEGCEDATIVRTKPFDDENSMLKCFNTKKVRYDGFVCQKGSLSKSEKGIVIGKIFQHKDKVYVGKKSSTIDPETDLLKFAINNSVFICTVLDVSSQNPEEIIKKANDIFKTL